MMYHQSLGSTVHGFDLDQLEFDIYVAFLSASFRVQPSLLVTLCVF